MARRHCHPAHGRAVSQQVHAGPLEKPCTAGRVHQVVRARDCGWVQGWLCQVHQVLPAKDALFIPLAPGLPPPGLPLKDFDHEDADEDDEHQNDAWQAVFCKWDEVPKSAFGPHLGAMSVHKELRIFQHWWVMVCVTCGRCSMWVNRKLRRDCCGNPSKLGMEVLKRMANRETPRSGQEWPLSVDVAPPTEMVVARV